MKIVLQQHHWQNGVQYDPGETIEVTQQEYDYIMGVYKEQRGQLVQSEAELAKKLSSVGELTEQQKKEAEAIGKKA